MRIQLGPLAFDLGQMLEYNPNYLPEKAFATFKDAEISLTGATAQNFHKCVTVYLDYVIGSRPDDEEEVKRRMKEVLPFMAL